MSENGLALGLTSSFDNSTGLSLLVGKHAVAPGFLRIVIPILILTHLETVSNNAATFARHGHTVV
jgi:hypothetical protein